MSSAKKWSDILPPQSLAKACFLLKKAQASRDNGETIYPPQSLIFNALTTAPPESVKAVIVGQDPYHGEGQANGLAFSVNPGVPIPASLKNIFKELNSDLGIPIPASGDLSRWAEQGVLLLNTVLTVRAGEANSHKDWGWQEFTFEIFKACTQLPQPIVFILWGAQARSFVANLRLSECRNKVCICSSHPSPLGAGKGSAAAPAFIGSKPFSQTNRLLQEMGAEPVNWNLQ